MGFDDDGGLQSRVIGGYPTSWVVEVDEEAVEPDGAATGEDDAFVGEVIFYRVGGMEGY